MKYFNSSAHKVQFLLLRLSQYLYIQVTNNILERNFWVKWFTLTTNINISYKLYIVLFAVISYNV
jgi:hypothetical protein